MQSNKEKISYTIGWETGRGLKEQFNDIDLSLAVSGFQDALSDATAKLPPEERRALLEALRKQMESDQKEFVAKIAAQNKAEGEAFLAKNQQSDGVCTLPSGLQYRVIAENKEGVSPQIVDTVLAHYRGKFINGTVFDSSYERGKPQLLPVNQLISGWAEALQKMKTGDKWEIFVPSYLAYGELGYGREIPPNTTLIFEMELLEVNPEKKKT